MAENSVPLYESNLFWGPLALGAGIVLAVAAAMKHDLRWLLWFAAPCFMLAIWAISRCWVRRWILAVVCVIGLAAVCGGMYWMNAWLGHPEVAAAPHAETPQLPATDNTSMPVSEQPPIAEKQKKKRHPAPLQSEASKKTSPEPASPQAPAATSQECAPGANCAMSSGQQGGITVGQLNLGPPPVQLTGTIVDIVPPLAGSEDEPRTPSKYKYEKEVTVSVNTAYTPVSIAIVCDSHLEEMHAFSEGIEAKYNSIEGISEDGKSAYAYFEGWPITPDHPLIVHIWANAPFSVLRVTKAKINIKPPS